MAGLFAAERRDYRRLQAGLCSLATDLQSIASVRVVINLTWNNVPMKREGLERPKGV